MKMNTVTLTLFKKFYTSKKEKTFKKCSREIDGVSSSKESEFSKVDHGRGDHCCLKQRMILNGSLNCRSFVFV